MIGYPVTLFCGPEIGLQAIDNLPVAVEERSGVPHILEENHGILITIPYPLG